MKNFCDSFEYFCIGRVRIDMKTMLRRLVLAVLISASAVSCTTAYDAYGNPREVVDPAAAAVGALAVGALAYGLASSNHHHYYRDDHYSRGYYSRPYRSYSGYGYNRGYCRY